jgi:hypothetical protein
MSLKTISCQLDCDCDGVCREWRLQVRGLKLMTIPSECLCYLHYLLSLGFGLHGLILSLSMACQVSTVNY